MAGLSPITFAPSPALDNVKLDGLIRFSKGLYLQSLAFSRLGDTFFAGARSITNLLERLGGLAQKVGMQRRGWIG